MIRDRINHGGKTFEEAISYPANRPRHIRVKSNGTTERLILTEVIKKYGKASASTIYKRIRDGWPLKKALLTTPGRRSKSKSS